MKIDQAPRLLLIGPLPNTKARKVGGARVSFAQLVAYIAEKGQPYQMIETQPYAAGWKRYLNPLLLFLKFAFHLPRTEVVWLNVSQGGTRYLAPLLYLGSKLFRKKFIFRPFGSSLKEDYEAYPEWQKWWFRKTALQADVLFLQTQTLVDFFRPSAKNIQHLPTSRKAQEQQVGNHKNYQKRFVFLGHIKADKGIAELLETSQLLDPSYSIHLYGPIMDADYQWLATQENPYYQGVLKQQEVTAKLSEYDVLILPTYFRGEGYPGAIIEAYSLGLPIITTNWRSIPEIVADGESGLLVPPRSTSALVVAMQSFNAENYPTFSAQAKQLFSSSFEQNVVLKKALLQIGIPTERHIER